MPLPITRQTKQFYLLAHHGILIYHSVGILSCYPSWHTISGSIFMKKVQPVVDAINTYIEALRKEVVDFEGRCERLLSSIDGSSRFGD